MMDIIKNMSVSILLGMLVHRCSVWIESNFLQEFLNGNLITLLVALMAINTTTMSVMMTKMSEIKEKHNINFPRTVREMMGSVYEQVALICVAVGLQIISDSPKVKHLLPDAGFFFSSLLVAVFIYAMFILFDTAKGIFVLLENEK